MKSTMAVLALCLPVLAQAGELSLSCVGAESNHCPVAVDVTLDRERLTAQYVQGMPGSEQAVVTLGWCGDTASGRGRWDTDRGCVTTGKFRVLNGELTRQQLADGAMQFEIHALMAMCQKSAAFSHCSVVARPAPRPSSP